jgi:hypothetical protein
LEGVNFDPVPNENLNWNRGFTALVLRRLKQGGFYVGWMGEEVGQEDVVASLLNDGQPIPIVQMFRGMAKVGVRYGKQKKRVLAHHLGGAAKRIQYTCECGAKVVADCEEPPSQFCVVRQEQPHRDDCAAAPYDKVARVVRTGKLRRYQRRLSSDYLNNVCMVAVAANARPTDVVEKISREVGVTVDLNKIVQRMRKLKRNKMSPRNEFGLFPDFVRQVKGKGGDGVYEIGEDRQIKSVGVVLPGAEAFMKSSASQRVSTVDGMHMKGPEAVGVVVLLTTKTANRHLILGTGWPRRRSR